MMDSSITYEQAALSRHEPVTHNLVLRLPASEAGWLLNLLSDAVIIGPKRGNAQEQAWAKEFMQEVDMVVRLMDALEGT